MTQIEHAFQNQKNVAQAQNLLNSAIDSVSQNRFPAVFSSTPIARLIKDKFKEKYQYANAIS